MTTKTAIQTDMMNENLIKSSQGMNMVVEDMREVYRQAVRMNPLFAETFIVMLETASVLGNQMAVLANLVKEQSK